jgi:hypothetical protein
MKRALICLLSGIAAWMLQAENDQDRNVFLITTDGLRWEEVFTGVDPQLINKEFGNIGNIDGFRAEFWAESPEERRRLLFPFLWSVGVEQGQIFGNRNLKSEVRMANPHVFSYPGYNEFLTGIVDPLIDSNDRVLNANTNVFEWLGTRPGFEGKIAASVNWGVLPWILNGPRSGFPIWSAFDVPEGTVRMQVPEILDTTARRGQTLWRDVTLDSFIGAAALHAVQILKPRAMYISYGETDDWAHEGHYERYIRSAHAFDRFLAELWSVLQSMPEYQGKTQLVLTADHGRGPAPVAWKSHGRSIPGSASTWFAVLGPDIQPLGERSETPVIVAGQTAATVASLVGETFEGERIAPAVPGLIK